MFLRQRYIEICEQVTAFFSSGCLQQHACEGQQRGFHPNLQDGFGGRLQQTLYKQHNQRQRWTTPGHKAAGCGQTRKQTTG